MHLQPTNLHDPQALPPQGILRVIPLGGVGEFGKNAMVLEYDDDMILVDCGQKFPEEEMFGVDLVIPDFSYVLDNLDRLRGIILTHGHEDHIGAVPFLMRQVPDKLIPIYGSRLTLALVDEKLKEMEIENPVELVEVVSGQTADLGCFRVDFMGMAHSFPDSMSLIIELPLGVVVHTGDYKLEMNEQGSCPYMDQFVERIGQRPVALLMGDSTNVDRRGVSPTEEHVRQGLEGVLAEADSTVILAAFASSLNRVQTVLELAQKFDRKVAICGFSLERNFGIASELGLVHYPADLMLPLKQLMRLPERQRLIITTGTQGEPLSVLSRMALDTFKSYQVQPGDLVILSSRMIPGNERNIYHMINQFYRRGARVVTERDAMVHGSGHAYSDEMLQMIQALCPRFFMPVHGEMRQLIRHGELAMEAGLEEDDIFILESGHQLEISVDQAWVFQTDWAGQVLVDGKVMDGVGEVVLRDRKHLSGDGMLTAIVVVDTKARKIIAGPDIVSRGFVVVDENEPLIEACKRVVLETFTRSEPENQEDWELLKIDIRKALRKFLREKTDRYPVILPVVVEI